MNRRLLIAACTLFIIRMEVFAQVKLEYKHPEGTWIYDTTTRIDQKLTLAGMDNDTGVDNRTTVRAVVEKPDPDGLVRVHETLDALQITMRSTGVDYHFDSAAPDDKGDSRFEMLRDVHKALVQRTTTTVFDKDNKVVSIASDHDVINKLPEQIAQLVKSQVNPENLKRAATQEMQRLPSTPVTKGDTWQRTELINFGAGQVMSFQTNYTYEGTVDKDGKVLHRISSKIVSVDFSLESDTPLPLKVKRNNLKVPESEAVILFDSELGQMMEYSSSLHIVGTILFEVNGQELPSKLDLKMQSNVVRR